MVARDYRKRDRISFWGNKNDLELDIGDGCTT
jgi:hypothetical protein